MTPFYRRDFPGAAISFTCVFAMAFSRDECLTITYRRKLSTSMDRTNEICILWSFLYMLLAINNDYILNTLILNTFF